MMVDVVHIGGSISSTSWHRFGGIGLCFGSPHHLKTKNLQNSAMKKAAANMAKILEVSLDWFVGNTDTELNTATLNRILDIDKLSQKDKELVFEFLDSFIANRKIKKAFT
ncbi:MAG: hypothetical protein QM768_17545 [Agriterribacter sp.]